MDPFFLHQDHGMQVAIRNGGTLVENNIILGSGNAFINIRMNPHPDLQPNSDSLIFRNNLGWQCRGPLAAYMGEETNSVTPVLWRDNCFGDFRYDYDRVYLARPESDHLIRVASEGIDVAFWGNIHDDPFIELFKRWGGSGNLIDMGNQRSTLPKPEFRGLPNDNFLDWKYYTDTVGTSENFPDKNTRKGESVTFQPGEIVGMPVGSQTRYYRCLKVAQGHPPTSSGDNFWELLVWMNGQDTSFIPPDDVRMTVESFYANRGMGVETKPATGGNTLLNQPQSVEEKRLKISPNPSTGKINISPPGVQEGLLSVYSPAGQHISESILPPGGMELDLGVHAPGLYFLRLIQGNEHFTGLVLIK